MNPLLYPNLVCLPVPEKVDRAIQPSLNDRPATGVMPLVTPDLHQLIRVFWFYKIDGACVMAIF